MLFARALGLRCPNCGGRDVFRHWFAMRETCPTCGLSLATGNRVGAYIFNIGAAEAVMVVVVGTIIVGRWPDPPWTFLEYLAPALMVAVPLVFYPFSKMLFVALDLSAYPGGRPDAAAHGTTLDVTRR